MPEITIQYSNQKRKDMNYTISMTDILLAVSVGCNLWFLFLLLYERIMDTRIVRFFKGIVGLWRSLDGNEAKRIAAHEEVPAEKGDSKIGCSSSVIEPFFRCHPPTDE